jgi:hypothetical protein
MPTVDDGPLSQPDDRALPQMGYTAISAQRNALDDGGEMSWHGLSTTDQL